MAAADGMGNVGGGGSGPRRPVALIVGLVAGVVIVLAAIIAAVVFLVLPEDDEPVADLATDRGTGEQIEAGDLDGTWSVVAGGGDEYTFAGYLVDEVFAAGAREVTARGESRGVEGSVVVADGAVTEASIVVDTTALESDEGRRDNAIRTRGLETERFPEATFELLEPIELPEGLTDGGVVTVPVSGELTLHGVAATVDVDIDVRPLGDGFTILARLPIEFSDHDIAAPSMGGFVTVEDRGQMEMRINLARG